MFLEGVANIVFFLVAVFLGDSAKATATARMISFAQTAVGGIEIGNEKKVAPNHNTGRIELR